MLIHATTFVVESLIIFSEVTLVQDFIALPSSPLDVCHVCKYTVVLTLTFSFTGVSLSLQMELEPLGLRSICVDFGYFRTNLLEQTNRAKQTGRIQDYAETIDQADSALAAYSGNQPGDPVKGAERVLDIVRGEGEAKGKAWPKTGVRLGTDVYEAVKLECESTLADLEEWKDVTCSTDL